MSVGMGVLIYRVFPVLMEESEALQEMDDLSYIGTEIKKEYINELPRRKRTGYQKQ